MTASEGHRRRSPVGQASRGRPDAGQPGAGKRGSGKPSGTGRLAAYQKKRDFGRTPEPAGEPPAPGSAPDPAARFVVQRHRARRLHYDLRFEMDGVLVSWAVPKGPTLDPDVRRIAIHVEDHPIEYVNFEGVIPSGGYGGGDVIVWDRGTWVPHATDDPVRAVADGELHVDVTGEKLRGRLILVRTGAASGPGKEQWLLLHKHDEDAVPGWDPEDHPKSVLSGRTNDEVKARPDRMWRGDLPAAEASVPAGPPGEPGSRPSGRKAAPAQGQEQAGRKAAPAPAEATTTAHASRSPGRRKPEAASARESPAAGLPAAGLPAAGLPAAGHGAAGHSADELSKLDTLGPAGSLDLFGRRLRLTNLDKVLFPARPGEEPVTKRELIRYAIQIAPVALPYLAGRPLNMHRFPGGADTAGFWQKARPEHAPDWIGRWDNPDADRGRVHTYLVVDEPATLVWAANFGALEWHAWTATTADPDRPTYALIDIDPGTATSWDDVLVLARLHRAALDHLGVLGRPKLTGRRGIQIWVPVTPGPSFEDTRTWVEQLSRSIGSVVPELVSWKWDVSERGGRARLDYTQNVSHKTLVAPYSPRAEAGAPISAPLEWDELEDPGLRPDSVTIRTAMDRLAHRGDPFRALLAGAQALPPVS
jgi:bifunctional non-homologous end joining protein LigD